MKTVLSVLTLALLLGSAFAKDAMVRVAHLSPDAPAVDVWINGHKSLSMVEFKAVSQYLPVPSGTVSVWVTPSGKASPKVINTRVTIRAGSYYTIAAIGNLKRIRARLYLDELRKPGPNSARVRVVHAAPGAPEVNIYAVKPARVLVASRLAFGVASPYVSTKAETYSFQAQPVGSSKVALSLEGVKLEGGRVYTIYVVGDKTLSTVLALDSE
mgnify:CR=1 FL=1